MAEERDNQGKNKVANRVPLPLVLPWLPETSVQQNWLCHQKPKKS